MKKYLLLSGILKENDCWTLFYRFMYSFFFLGGAAHDRHILDYMRGMLRILNNEWTAIKNLKYYIASCILSNIWKNLCLLIWYTKFASCFLFNLFKLYCAKCMRANNAIHSFITLADSFNCRTYIIFTLNF